MLRELTQALEALAREIPLVLLLEDLHWSDYCSSDLILHLATRREAASLLLLATYRPVEVILNDHPLKRSNRNCRYADNVKRYDSVSLQRPR